jgi:Zn-dependent peptidase ImmA (M78 family)/transcriptional regulator with XRE-family HTH domain
MLLAVPLHLPSFAAKLRRFREMIGESVEDVAGLTGIPEARIVQLELATHEPTGDEVLILADHYRQDFQFFISNQDTATIDRTEKLFRAYAKELSTHDRRNIQEFLFLVEGEAFLLADIDHTHPVAFKPIQRGTYYKQHAWDTAPALRATLGYAPREVPDVFRDLRRLGVHVFRRRLSNQDISGLFLNHPTAGPCILVNYDEDVYRQRFTAAHEMAHALFDTRDDFVVSLTWEKADLKEVRADNFANAYLVPDDVLNAIPKIGWTPARHLDLAKQLHVNPEVLTIAMRRKNLVSDSEAAQFATMKIPRTEKTDPELPTSLSEKTRARKEALLERGISGFYADLAFDAYDRGGISRARLAELLLVAEGDLREQAALFGKELA